KLSTYRLAVRRGRIADSCLSDEHDRAAPERPSGLKRGSKKPAVELIPQREVIASDADYRRHIESGRGADAWGATQADARSQFVRATNGAMPVGCVKNPNGGFGWVAFGPAA